MVEYTWVTMGKGEARGQLPRLHDCSCHFPVLLPMHVSTRLASNTVTKQHLVTRVSNYEAMNTPRETT